MPTLHPQIVEVLKLQQAAGLRPIEAMSPAEARAQMEATARARKAEPLHVKQVEEQEIAGPGGPIRLRLYWPDATGLALVKLKLAVPLPLVVTLMAPRNC